jgi:SNF2 family DNA or RNA helicase
MEHLLQHDIVLTTYATLASEYQNEQSLLYETNWFRLVLDEVMFHKMPFFDFLSNI